MKTRILFVYDTSTGLSELQRSLWARFDQGEWELSFAENAEVAVANMASQPFDILVADMQMAGMRVDQLLGIVMTQYPHTIRFVLSDFSDRHILAQSMGVAHQFLSKPCDPDALFLAVTRTLALHEVLEKESLRKLMGQIKALPAMPKLYLKIVAELKSPEATAQRVADIISQDIAMSTRILQMVNSSFFGLTYRVDNISQAVSLLGMDVVKALILMVTVFSGAKKGDRNLINWLWKHSQLVARCSKMISESVQSDSTVNDQAFMMGLLHDLGRLVMAVNLPKQYGEVLAMSRADQVGLLEAEQQTFGVTHCEVGAYLLGQWGFSDVMIEAVLYHHSPCESHFEGFTALAAVHAGNVIASGMSPMNDETPVPCFDPSYLEQVGVLGRVDEWRDLCAEACFEGELPACS